MRLDFDAGELRLRSQMIAAMAEARENGMSRETAQQYLERMAVMFAAECPLFADEVAGEWRQIVNDCVREVWPDALH